MTLYHIWSFLCFLIAASTAKVLYPSINGSEILSCICPDHQCQKVHWYRLLHSSGMPEFLVTANNLNIPQYSKTVKTSQFKTSIIETVQVTYNLRILAIQKEDAGFYSCVLTSQNAAQDPKDLMPEGYSIRPGESISTLAPTTVKIPKHKIRTPKCKLEKQSPKGCKSLVLWSGISAVLLLFVVLIATLYYFSRLPKKCRHHFLKNKQLR